MTALLAAGTAWNAQLGYSVGEVGFAAASLAVAAILAVAALRYFIALHRLRAIWQRGTRVDVVLKKSIYFWTRAYRSTVELDGRQATVILSATSDLGGTLPALVDDDRIAVSDFGGCLKTGRLRRP